MPDEQGQVAVKVYGDASSVTEALDSAIAKVERFAQETGDALKEWGAGAEKSMSVAAQGSARYSQALDQVEAKTTASLNRLAAAHTRYQSRVASLTSRFNSQQIAQAAAAEAERTGIEERAAAQRVKFASEAISAVQKAKQAADRVLIVGQEQTNARLLRLDAQLARAQGNITKAAEQTRRAVLAESKARILDDKMKEDAAVLSAEQKFQRERQQIIEESNARILAVQEEAGSQQARAIAAEASAMEAEEADYQAARLRTQQESDAEALRLRQEYSLRAARISAEGGAEQDAAEGSALEKALSIQKAAADKAVALTTQAEAKSTEIVEKAEARKVELLAKGQAAAEKTLATGQAKSEAMMAKDVDKAVAILQAATARKNELLNNALAAAYKVETEAAAKSTALKSKAAAEGLAVQQAAAEKSMELLDTTGALENEQLQARLLARTNILREGEARAAETEASGLRALEALELGHAARVLEIQAGSESEVQGAVTRTNAVLVKLEDEKNASVQAAETVHQDAMTAIVAEGVKKREALERQGAEVAQAEAAGVSGVGGREAGRSSHSSYDLRHAGFGLMVTAGLLASPIIEATKSYTEFDAQLHKILAQAGERLLTFNQLQAKTLALSRQLGVAPATVASTLFNDESAGFHGDDAFTMSKSSLRLAVAGRSKPEDAANVLTKVLTAYSLPAGAAPYVSDRLIKAVGLSHTDLSHFGPAVSNGAQDAANAHVDLDSYLASLATVTRVAPNANISATGLRNFNSHLVRPTPAMNKAFHAAGLGDYADGNAPTMLEKPGGFDLFINRAKAATGGNSAKMAALFPDLRTERGAFPLLRDDEQGRGFTQIHKEQKDSTGATDKAFAEQDKSFERKLERFHATSNAFMMDFLSVAKGLAEPIIGKLVDLGNKLIDGWNKLPESGKKAAVIVTLLTTGLLALAGVIATVAFFVEPVIAVFGALSKAFLGVEAVAAVAATSTTAAVEGVAAVPGILAALTGPIGWVIAGLTALGIAWATNLGGIRDKTSGILKAVEAGFKEALDFVVGYVRAGLAEASAFWNEHHKEIEIICAMIYESVRTNLALLYAIFLHVWPLIAGVVKAAWATIVLVFRSVKTVLEAIVITLLDVLSGHWSRWWSDMKKLAADMGPDLETAFENIFKSLGEGIISSFSGTIAQVKAMWLEAVHEIAHGTFNLGDIIGAGNQASLGAMGAVHKEYGPTGTPGAGGANVDPYGDPGLPKKSAGNGDPYGDPGSSLTPTGPIGARMAAIAQAMEHVKGFAGECDKFSRTISDKVNPAFDRLYSHDSAKATMQELKARGIGQAYTGGPLAPGTLAWTSRMGGKSGHAMHVGPNGGIIDDFSNGEVPLSRRKIDWVVNPDIAAKQLGITGVGTYRLPANGEMLPPDNGPGGGWLNALKAKKKVKSASLGSSATPTPPLFPSTAPSVAAIMGFANAYTKSDAALLKLSTTAANVKLKLTALDDQEAHNINSLGKHAGQVKLLSAQLAVNADRHTVLTAAEASINKEITAQAAKTREALLHWHGLSVELDSHAAAIKKVNDSRAKMKSGTPEYAAETARVVKMNAVYALMLKQYHDAERVFTQQDAAMKRYGSELQFVKERQDSVAKSSARMNASLDHATGKAERDKLAALKAAHETFFRGQAADKADGTDSQARRDAMNGEAGQIAKDYGLKDEQVAGQTAVQLRDTIAGLNDKTPAATLALADLDTVIKRLGQIDLADAKEVTRGAREKLQSISSDASLTKGGKADAITSSLAALAQANVPEGVDANDPVAAEAALKKKNESLAALYHEYYDKIGTLRKEDSADQFQEYIRQTEAGRKALLDRALHYGLDRDAFKNAMDSQAADLEKRLLGDVELEGISQANILALVQQRLADEQAAYAAADDQHKADLKTKLDQDTQIANQLAATFSAGQKAQKQWDKGFDETEKVAKQVGDRIGTDIGDMVTKSGHHMESLKTIMRDTFADILKQIIVKFVEGAIVQLARVGFDQLHGGAGDGDSPAKTKASPLGILNTIGGVASSFTGGSSAGGGSLFGSGGQNATASGGGGSSFLSGLAGFAGIGQTLAGLFSAHAVPAAAAASAAASSAPAAGPAAATPSNATASGAAAGGAGSGLLAHTLSVPAISLPMGLAYHNSQQQAGGGLGSAGQDAKAATGAIGALGAAGGGLTRVFGSGLGGALGSALPVIGGVLALASLASSLFGQTKPDYTNKTGKTEFASVAGRDYTASLDSGYSGDSGMRQVLRAHQDAMNRLTATAAMQQSPVHFAAGAVQVNGIHPGNTQEVADALTPAIADRLSSSAGIHAAATGTGVS